MYGFLTTYPERGSRNVGDHLITHSAKAFLRDITDGDPEVITFFRSDDVSDCVSDLSSCDAVFLPGFAIREPIDETYTILKHLDEVSAPLVPLGAGWKSNPGDFKDSLSIEYSSKTVEYLQRIGSNLETFGVREYYTRNALQNNGIENATLVGDCAWYHPDFIGQEMNTPDSVSRVVLTTPHSDRYERQAKMLADSLVNLFPDSELICSLHSVPTSPEKRIAEYCGERGFEIKRVAGDVSNIDFYEECDLHVGYRVHGHIAFLRLRQPSVLLNEDGRGAGFSYTFGTGGFNAFRNRTGPEVSRLRRGFEKSGPIKSVRNVLKRKVDAKYAHAPPIESVIDRVMLFLQEELDNDFRRYQHVPQLIDHTYRNRMRPLIKKHVK